jgi:hypothetical protein
MCVHYCILIHTGKGGGELTREKVKGTTQVKTTFRVCRLYSYLVHHVELKNDLALVGRELPGLGLLELLEPAGELRLPPLQQVLRPRVRLLLSVIE